MSEGQPTVGGVNVSRETLEKLQGLVDLMKKWTKSINLIAPATVPTIWERHIEDSAQILQYAPSNWSNWVDLGSGGGLPGLVIAILDEKRRPITLVESDTRKCLFLNTARREFDLNVVVENMRIEIFKQTDHDVVSARALAPLTGLLGHANQLLKDDGTALFPKGEKFQEELDEARKVWHFDSLAHPSKTNANAHILEISRISRREP